MQRQTVLLLFGGESSEHEVSINSARNVYAAMDETRFDVVLCFIDKQGKWWLLDEFFQEIDTHQSPQLVAALGGRSFLTLPGAKVISPDVIFPVLHGKNGEDGSVQGLAQLLHIPIVGCDMTGSVLAMDKVASKEIFMSHGFRTSAFEVHRKGMENPVFDTLKEKLGATLFIKPSRAGSSVGVSKVQSQAELDVALQLAHEHDDQALIEQAIVGREVEVAILGDIPNHQASGVGEIRPDRDFYSYESKYSNDSSSEVIIPAQIDETVSEEIRQFALDVYMSLGCKGMARVDFFLTDDNTVFINEVNTIPGFTNISMYPKLWRQAGVSYQALIEQLIINATA